MIISYLSFSLTAMVRTPAVVVEILFIMEKLLNHIVSEEILDSNKEEFLEKFRKLHSSIVSYESCFDTLYGKYLKYYLLFTWLPDLVTNDIVIRFYNRLYWHIIYQDVCEYTDEWHDLLGEFGDILNENPNKGEDLVVNYWQKAHADAAEIIANLKKDTIF